MEYHTAIARIGQCFFDIFVENSERVLYLKSVSHQALLKNEFRISNRQNQLKKELNQQQIHQQLYCIISTTIISVNSNLVCALECE